MASTYTAGARWRETVRANVADRTAVRDVRASLHSSRWGDREVKTWPTRAAMAAALRREERSTPNGYEWCAVVALAITEGY